MELCLTQSSKFVHAQPLTIVSKPCRNLITYMFRSSPADLPNRNLLNMAPSKQLNQSPKQSSCIKNIPYPLDSTIAIVIFCTDFCHVPSISSSSGASSSLWVIFSHLQVNENSFLYGYLAITRELGTFTWRQTISRPGLGRTMHMTISSLKPFTNYTIRIFPKSFLGYRLGSEARLFSTGEAGMKCS